jgi:hypothetical protein
MDWELFDAIYLINLPERTDRRRELEIELSGVGITAHDRRLVWVRAVRPSDAGEFPSVGARGCFLSHLVCLKSALDSELRRVLIIEDDACFPKNRHADLRIILEKVKRSNWDIWYGGARVQLDVAGRTGGIEIVAIDPKLEIQTTHCVALQGDTIRSVQAFFELILRRPAGHAEAGPMHVDGAYSTWRALNPNAVTLLTVPPVCTQRASRSDIAATHWYDRMPVVKLCAAILRRLRNRLKPIREIT